MLKRSVSCSNCWLPGSSPRSDAPRTRGDTLPDIGMRCASSIAIIRRDGCTANKVDACSTTSIAMERAKARAGKIRSRRIQRSNQPAFTATTDTARTRSTCDREQRGSHLQTRTFRKGFGETTKSISTAQLPDSCSCDEPGFRRRFQRR